MASTILYKFRTGTTFEVLPLSGSVARLFEIKKAIVTAKKLDQGARMDFILSIQDATSGQEYMDDNAIIPRGTRLVVQRLPASRGQGILAAIARSQHGGYQPRPPSYHNAAPDDYYTIESAGQDDEQFIPMISNPNDEIAALRAATETVAPPPTGRPSNVAGSGPPPPRTNQFQSRQRQFNRPNADPGLRDQAMQQQPKKRTTGIPRPFIRPADGADGTASHPLLQPNAIGFEELVNRAGGQSENVAGTKKDFDYAIKLTATTIPDFFKCAICHEVVRDAMMLPWDSEGRTTCESCIRNSLTDSGFRCPLTQQEGVSPDDLLPNYALRKAAEQFIKEVMVKVQEIDKEAAVEEEIVEAEGRDAAVKALEADAEDGGVVLTRGRASVADKRKKDDDYPFPDVDFGADVLEVEPIIKTKEDGSAQAAEVVYSSKEKPHVIEEPKREEVPERNIEKSAIVEAPKATETSSSNENVPEPTKSAVVPPKKNSPEPTKPETSGKRERLPVGYAMGPAGGSDAPRGGGSSPYGVRLRGDKRYSNGGRGGGRGDECHRHPREPPTDPYHDRNDRGMKRPPPPDDGYYARGGRGRGRYSGYRGDRGGRGGYRGPYRGGGGGPY